MLKAGRCRPLPNAPTLSEKRIKASAHIAVHYPVPEWSGLITGLAFANSPADVYAGPVYEFNMNHVIRPESWRDIFSIETVEL